MLFAGTGFANFLPALLNHVRRVILFCAEKQMVWFNAIALIAFM